MDIQKLYKLIHKYNDEHPCHNLELHMAFYGTNSISMYVSAVVFGREIITPIYIKDSKATTEEFERILKDEFIPSTQAHLQDLLKMGPEA
jgi:hypothetical protein